MTNKNKAIVIAIIAGLGVIGGGLYLTKIINSESNEISYQDVRQDFKENNYRMIDGNTDLTNYTISDLNNLKKWELEKEKYGKKPYKPPEFMSVVAKTPDDLIKLLNNEKSKLLSIKKKVDNIDCQKVKERSDCKNIKTDLDNVEYKYSNLITEIQKFNTYGKLY